MLALIMTLTVSSRSLHPGQKSLPADCAGSSRFALSIAGALDRAEDTAPHWIHDVAIEHRVYVASLESEEWTR